MAKKASNKSMAPLVGDIDYQRLNEICAATAQGGSVYSSNDAMLQRLCALGYAEINSALFMSDDAGNVASYAARATSSGMAAWQVWKANQHAMTTPQAFVAPADKPVVEEDETPSFEIEEFAEVPAVTRGEHLRPRKEKFPFTKLMPGQRFFIPQEISDKNGDVVRHYSACNSAGHRLRDLHNELVATGQPVPTTLVPKHFNCVTVKAGQILDVGKPTQVTVKADGEYVFCLPGWIDPPKPRDGVSA
jgi:hypothetical protein